MKKQANNSRQSRYILMLLILGGLLFLTFSASMSIQRGKSKIQKDAADTLELVKTNCQKYDDYEMGIVTKDLQALINKANALRDYITMDDDALRKMANDQYLSGVTILDENLNTVREVKTDEQDYSEFLQLVVSDVQAQEILEFPQKVFADRIELDGRIYEYSIAAQRDAVGLIICYSDTTALQNDKYEISLSNMLDMDLQNSDEVLVVTDGSHVITSNVPELDGISVQDCPIKNVISGDKLPDNDQIIELENDGVTWFGRYDVYRSYYLYVFYRSNRMYSGLLLQMSISLGLYLAFCLMLVLVQQQQRKEKLLQLEKEYHLVDAIASIYDINLLIHPEQDTWEPVIQTEKLKRLITGIKSANNMLNMICNKLLPPNARDEFRRFVDLHTLSERLQGKPFLGYTLESTSGKWYQVLLVPQLREDNRITSVMLLLRNITEQKQKELDYQEQLRATAEQAAIANASKTDFLRRMSHDIRTPINGIRGMTDIGMTCLQKPARVKSCFDKIRTASDFLLELVNNVLDMSKIEAGEIETTKEPFDLRDVVQNAATIVSSQAMESGIDFQCKPMTGEHWHLLGSPLNIQRVFQNIMSNAVKYNRSGGSVTVSCQETDCTADTATFVFLCADTGIGMSEAFQSHAFDIFSQEHKTARTTYNGSGLGLSIAKKTVDLLGGTITVESQEGKGSIFTVTLSLAIDHEYEKAETTQAENTEECSIQGVHVLIAEDNELNMEIAVHILQEQGAIVTPVSDGKQAVDAFNASSFHTFDVILMDIMMPVMNGLEAAQAIRALPREDAAVIPIIAVSANAFSDDIAASRASGINEHLSKPLDFAKVIQAIYRYTRA